MKLLLWDIGWWVYGKGNGGYRNLNFLGTHMSMAHMMHVRISKSIEETASVVYIWPLMSMDLNAAALSSSKTVAPSFILTRTCALFVVSITRATPWDSRNSRQSLSFSKPSSSVRNLSVTVIYLHAVSHTNCVTERECAYAFEMLARALKRSRSTNMSIR